MLARQRQHRVHLLPPILQVDRVEHRAPWIRLQRGLHDAWLSGVDHQRRFDPHLQLLDGRRHLLGLIGPLGDGHLHVEHMRAALHLLARDDQQRVVVVAENCLLRLAAALRVDPLADQQRRGILRQRGRAHGGGHQQLRALGGLAVEVLQTLQRAAQLGGGELGQMRDDAANVLRRRAAAAADDVDAELADEFA